MSTSRKLAWGTVAVGTPRVITEMRGDNWAVAVNPLATGTVLVEVCWGPDVTTADWRTATNQAGAAMTAIAAGAASNARVAVFTAPAPMGLRITASTAACEYELVGREILG